MNGSSTHINLRSVIGLLRAFIKLVARCVGFGLGVLGSKLFFVIRRAAFAQSSARVPADFRTNPFAASCALVKVLFGFFDGDGKSVIVGFAANGALNVVGAIACVGKNSAENVACRAQQIACNSGHRRLKARHVTVSAFVAMKLELVPAICGKIVVIGRKSNECHVCLLLVVIERGTVRIWRAS